MNIEYFHKDYFCSSLKYCCFSLFFSHSVVSNSLRPCGLPHARLFCPSPSSIFCSNSCLLSQWCHPTISSSVAPFSFSCQCFPASGSFPKSLLFTSGDWSTGVSASASVLPMNVRFKIFVHTLQHVGSCFPVQGSEAYPCVGRSSLNHWTARPVPPSSSPAPERVARIVVLTFSVPHCRLCQCSWILSSTALHPRWV